MTPSPLVCVLLALAVQRSWRLAALDTFPPLVWARDRLVGVTVVQSVALFERPLLAEWLQCVWCSGLWWAAGWYLAWLAWPHGAMYAAVPLALSAGAATLQSLLPD